jgi:hypothetical protein
VLEWKRKQKAGRIGQSIQEWLDRFYMSRIGIRFLIGQREYERYEGDPGVVAGPGQARGESCEFDGAGRRRKGSVE